MDATRCLKKTYTYFVSFMYKEYTRKAVKLDGPYNRVIELTEKVITRDQVRKIEKDILNPEVSNMIQKCVVLTSISLLNETEIDESQGER